MLYPKNRKKVLDPALFKNPTSEYRGTPFWAWNCQLEEKELLRQLDVLKEMGFGGGHLHVRTGMATPYLSKEYMDLVTACLKKARRNKMLTWLYDEDRWPSGAAGGLVTKEERFRARYVVLTTRPYEGDEGNRVVISGAQGVRTGKGDLLARYDVMLDANGCLASYHRLRDGEEAAGTAWYLYLEIASPSPWYNNQTYVDTLNPEAMKRFIDITYEAYNNTPEIKKEFGKSIPSMFTDEPQFTHKQLLPMPESRADVILPWTNDLEDTFTAAYGCSLLDSLPEVLWELPEGVSPIRYYFHDHVAERFATAFADQCGSWCREHGLKLTGHMMEEPSLHSQTAALGEAMRSYRAFDLPGIDMLCDGVEITTAKQTQSAVHQFGCEGMVSELYGVTGWDFDFRGHKYQGDWQAALGVTVRVPHLAWVSMKGEAKRDYPASINYQSPWWTEYRYVEDHYARVNTAMTRGKPCVRIGVVHPIESYWLHWGPASQTDIDRHRLDSRFQELTNWLLRGSCDFDFICESLLPRQCAKGGAPLKVGKMAYDVILVPGCETLRSTTLERLEAFQKAGGKLVFMGEAPLYEDARPSDRGRALYGQSTVLPYDRTALMDTLEPYRLVGLRNGNGTLHNDYVYQLRRDGDNRWLFVATLSRPAHKDICRPRWLKVEVAGTWRPTVYNTLDGTTAPISATHGDGKTVMSFTMHEQDSLLLLLEPCQAGDITVETPPAATYRSLPMVEQVDYSLSEPNVLLLDKAAFALDDGEWQSPQELLRADNTLRRMAGFPERGGESVPQPWSVPKEDITHTARLRFTVTADIRITNPVLALEDADVARITVNGKPVNNAPRGYYVDKSIGKVSLPPLHKGENTIEVALPFGRTTAIEWCYLLGRFGVSVSGTARRLTAMPVTLGFDDITRMGLPYYGGVVTYHIPVESHGGELTVETPHYRAATIGVALDGQSVGHIAYQPYRLSLGTPVAGQHMVSLSLYISRQNAFGHVHHADENIRWIGPDAWRSKGNAWTESYRLRPEGLLSAPIISEAE